MRSSRTMRRSPPRSALTCAARSRPGGGAPLTPCGPASRIGSGVFGRAMGYREANPGRGYFAPDRFGVLEARTAYTWGQTRWGVRADGGVGAQQVGRGASRQTEWHAGFTVTRGWGANSELALVGSVTNSAASRTGIAVAPGFKYWTLGLRLRQGL